MKRAALLLAGLLLSTSASAVDLYIDLRSDYTATEFRFVRVELIDRVDERRSWTTFHVASSGLDYRTGARIAEFSDVETRHNYFLTVELLDGLMRTVHGRVFLQRTGDAGAQSTIALVVRP